MGAHVDRAEHSEQHEQPQPPVTVSADAGDALDSIGEIMGQVARALQEEHGDVAATLEAITQSAVNAVPGTEECGISLVVGKQVSSRAPVGELPRLLDELQERLAEGPCLDALMEHRTVRLDDMASEERWPRFCRQATEAGVGSMLSFQLFVTGGSLGALNLYARTPHAFDEESESVGLVFASHAAIALAGAENEQDLRTALTSRDLIGQAKGILMERFKITADQAFAVLVGASSRTNRKLTDIAEELSATGTLPHAGRRRD